MSSTSFTIASTDFSIYAGFPIFCFGIIGNVINVCLLFSTRAISCSFLLIISSFFNIIALLFGLLPRLLSLGFSIDASSTSLIWCKSRLFISYIGTIGSLTCICFASTDRFLMSCRSVAWRNRSQLKTARIAIVIASLIIIVINIPYVFFYALVEVKTSLGNITTRCSATNSDFTLYGNYFLRPVLLGVLPGIVLITTGLLTYRNISSIAGIQLRDTFQRSLTSMIFLQIIVVVLPIIPFATINIYQTVTSSVAKTSYRVAQETLVSNVCSIVLYISYASNFYVYLISASSYRRDFVRFALCCFHQNHRNNRVGLATRQQYVMNATSVGKQFLRSIPRITT